MTQKIRRVRAEEYAYCVNKLRQNVGLETWIWRQIVTSQTAHQTQMTIICHWMKPLPWRFSAYATAYQWHCYKYTWLTTERYSLFLSVFSAGLRSRKESEVFEWNRIPITTPGVGVGLFWPTSTPEVQLNHFLHRSPKVGTPVEMVQFLLKLSLKQIIIAVYHDFHWLLVATKLLAVRLHSRYVTESVSDILERLELVSQSNV